MGNQGGINYGYGEREIGRRIVGCSENYPAVGKACWETGTFSRFESESAGSDTDGVGNRMPMEGCAEMIRFRHNVLEAIEGLAKGGCMGEGSPRIVEQAQPEKEDRLGVEQARQFNCAGGKRGDKTGADPTNRGKYGVKRHILSDGRGTPIGVCISVLRMCTIARWLLIR